MKMLLPKMIRSRLILLLSMLFVIKLSKFIVVRYSVTSLALPMKNNLYWNYHSDTTTYRLRYQTYCSRCIITKLTKNKDRQLKQYHYCQRRCCFTQHHHDERQESIPSTFPENTTQIQSNFNTNNKSHDDSQKDILVTSALLMISYDGRHFTGWSSANDQHQQQGPRIHHDGRGRNSVDVQQQSDENNDSNQIISPQKSRNRNRRRQLNYIAFDNELAIPNKGFVRSVQGTVQQQLSKLYGNIPVSQIIVEGCSRTDKGVHAFGNVAQIYCLSSSSMEYINTARFKNSTITTSGLLYEQPSIPGKYIPHPWNATDRSHYFIPIPKPLPDLVLALNRMLYPEIQIISYAPVPSNFTSSALVPIRPFHPTTSARSKTYRYTFSIGPIHDPTQWRSVWHVGSGNGQQQQFNLSKVKCASQCFIGTYNFSAFYGTPRSASDKEKYRRMNTTCTIQSISISERNIFQQNTITYDIDITGNRFLYKMVRFMVGAMIAVGKGVISISDMELLLYHNGTRQEQRNIQFECAPSYALVLLNVSFDIPIDWNSAMS